ncbi:ABC transporter ATP-binding protein [Telmatospirillum sp.]|uniref:ABC transporter ATP-binding protein n=1 Tax=Telmatospirillum sp. TaxID=2079197 RepID=UPI0028489CAC|nr:ABC transporter ATP-binding protein [Telmatospirillum sp.]MDR3441329.1 ABC transporter ATP-binding protein [Telmatospirillum sp.]
MPALREIDLDIRAREILFLVGPSGCGKTTLISVIAGLLRPDTGRSVLFGTDPEALSPATAAAFRRDNIGFVFQSYNLIPQLSVQDNVMIPLLLQGNRHSIAAAAARAALVAVGLGQHADKTPSELSGGQQQRVAIARAIIHSPKLIVCDEPTSALDHKTGQEIMHLLRGLAHDRGTTLIVVTHDQRIYDYADRITEMDDGRIVSIREPAEWTDGGRK